MRRSVAGIGLIAAVVLTGCQSAPVADESEPAPVPLPAGLDLGRENRAAPLPGLPDWSRAGYREGENLPGDAQYNPDPACRITPGELANQFDVRPDDGEDDSAGIQSAIDKIRTDCTPAAGFDKLSLIIFPAGTLEVGKQLWVDADYLTLRGAGHSTRVVFRPDENTRYDTLTADGSAWDPDAMTCGDAKGGWLWPGRGLFRVQSQAIEESYQDSCTEENRQDLTKGTVNVHWKAGVKLAAKPGGGGIAAHAGDTEVHLAKKAKDFQVGGLVNIRAANTTGMYEQQQALPTEHELQNLHLRQRMYRITAVGEKSITLDRPLDFDVPVTSVSDGSAPIDGDEYDSKAAPVVDPVVGVGFESFAFTQEVSGLTPDRVRHDYGNFAPESAMHGIVFKWAADSWVRNVRIEMAGSHPIVTEEAKNLQIVGNHLEGSWNKGKGGNGYLRGSRVWDSVYANNTTRGLRHFTLQWSAAGNVVIGNDFDSDLNLHGGWERQNLFEHNTVRVPAAHGPGNCTANCGAEGGGSEQGTWYPIWWGAGKKAVKWSGATGPQNVFFRNTLAKQNTPDGPFEAYGPYGTGGDTVFQFGWNAGKWQHLERDGVPIADWAGSETTDFAGHGVDTGLSHPGPSLFLRALG
ncbi:hypothetical protein [Amycolatopsis sp. YIM 10]|uniref:hypothetical protein n=1 Tax=Amycolatopsis sp. YIM 10 TaxID=2653857 RepID=UPI00128FDD10|nr:hypothetical protein [Amycolatopsis sp. YIM 10]QFU89179.1 hypothetical protein YIM_20000 [Amycolatopsis sp. YIM 10]